MITRVNNVMIANADCPASYSTAEALNKGEIALFDENRNIIANEDAAIKANKVYVGICNGTMKVVNPTSGALEDKKQIEFSTQMQKNTFISSVLTEYEAPVQEKIEFNLASAQIVTGHRYVLRIVYKDMFEAPGQFTHTYEVIAASETAQDLCDAFGKAINKHANKRVSVDTSSNKIVLTALEKDDNEGVHSLNEYSIVSMEASLYVTIPGALLSNIPEAVSGVTMTKTAGKPGKGYWKQVRDMEYRNMGYKGMVFTDSYPVIEQERKVDSTLTYDCLIVENDNKYLSPDNQYVKDTPNTVSVFCKAGSLKASQFMKNLNAFITGKAAE